MSIAITAALLNLLGIGLLVGTRRVCKKLNAPAPPLKLPLIAALTLPWLSIIDTHGAYIQGSRTREYLETLNWLIISWTAIRLTGWLALEVAPRINLWRTIPKILRDLLMLSVGVSSTLGIIHYRLGINLAGLAATSAFITAVLAFAAQSTLKDIFAGIALQIDAPFQEGDWIDAGFARGMVTSLRLMSTRLKTIDGAEVVIPNSRIAVEGLRRFDKIGPRGNSIEIALDNNFAPSKAVELVEKILKEHTMILDEPKPQCWVYRYSEAGIVYRLQYWQREIGELGASQLRSKVHEQIWYALHRSGQVVPYPGLVLRQNDFERIKSHKTATAAERTRTMKKCGLFRTLDHSQLEQLALNSFYVEYGPGETVVRQGELGSILYIIDYGSCVVSVEQQGDEETRLGILGEGDIFGEMAFFTGRPRAASIRCGTESNLLAIDREDLLPLIQESPHTLELMIQLIAERESEIDGLYELGSRKGDGKALAQKIRSFFKGLLREKS